MNRGPEIVLGVVAGIGLGFILGSFTGGAMLPWTSAEPREVVQRAIPVEPVDVEPEEVLVEVEILGEGVEHPGKYELSPDSQVIDLIEEAGGLTPGAVQQGIPWREYLHDDLLLSIPTQDALREVAEGERALETEDLLYFRGDPDDIVRSAPEDESEDRININEASLRELQELYRIGPGLAGRIVQYREEIGGFERPEQIKEVPGIGDVTYQQIRPNIEI